MATKNTKKAESQPKAAPPVGVIATPAQINEAAQPPPAPSKPPEKPSSSRSRAKAMQEHSEEAVMQPVSQIAEEIIATTLRTDVGFEYHLDLPRSVVSGILDPDTPDAFIEVPCPRPGSRRFLHTAFVKEIDVRGFA